MRFTELLRSSAIALLLTAGNALLAQSAQLAISSKPAEQVYKNIQVLKGVPADQIIPAMQFIAASLGVQCDFCHLENAFEKDDKQTKQTARKMMRMMLAINKDNFEGQREVTCYACHRGAHQPVTTPVLSEDNVKVAEHHHMHDEEAAPSNLPSGDQILGQYLQAVGGAEAAAKISTRSQKGTLTVGSERFPVEIIAKAPSDRVTTVHFPGADSVTAVNSQEGWLSTPSRGVNDMSPLEADAARMDAELFFPASLKQIFKELHTLQQGKLNGEDVYVVAAMTENAPATQLYFDQHSALLLRVLRFTETPLGQNPTQIDYADYREQDGTKTPFRWTITRPSGSFTIQIEQMKQNVAIPAEAFAKAAK